MAVRRTVKTAYSFATFAVLVALLSPSPVLAGGFFIADRGTRSLARGTAYIAGVEDPHALWYNPAGLAFSGDQLLLDLTLTLNEVSYTRVDGGGNTLPTVTGHHAYAPIPTIAGSFSIDELPEWTFGIGFFAPNSSLMEWPDSISVDGVEQPAPQRYSIYSLEGSAMSWIALGAAWRPIEELSIGLGANFLFGTFATRVALSACDGVICSFPEDPEYDAVAQISLPFFYPFFTLGATAVIEDIVRIGASVQTPFTLEGSALIRVRPPNAAAFNGAEVVNRRADCDYEDVSNPCRNDTRANASVEFPWFVRLGVEVRPVPELRIEAAVEWETWSVQDAARISPDNVWIQGALGGGLEYQVGPINIPRQMHDTVSVRLGGEYNIENVVTVALGASFENGAFDDQYLSALTVDSEKLIAGGGVSIYVSPEVIFDIAAGYIWMAPRTVTNSLVPQPNPIRPPANMSETIYVGNGDYSAGAPYFGLGFRWRGDSGNIRGPGEEEPQEELTEPAPSVAEPVADVPGPAPVVSPAPSNTAQPWWLQGQQAQPAPSPSQEPAPAPEERPRRRRR